MHRQKRGHGTIAQLVEQRTENPCVPGSIPGGTTLFRHNIKNKIKLYWIGTIAQLVEQRTENPCVPGSIPGGTTREPHEKGSLFFYKKHQKKMLL